MCVNELSVVEGRELDGFTFWCLLLQMFLVSWSTVVQQQGLASCSVHSMLCLLRPCHPVMAVMYLQQKVIS